MNHKKNPAIRIAEIYLNVDGVLNHFSTRTITPNITTALVKDGDGHAVRTA